MNRLKGLMWVLAALVLVGTGVWVWRTLPSPQDRTAEPGASTKEPSDRQQTGKGHPTPGLEPPSARANAARQESQYGTCEGRIHGVGIRRAGGQWSSVHFALKGGDGKDRDFTVSVSEARKLGLVVQALGTTTIAGEGRHVRIKEVGGSVVSMEDIVEPVLQAAGEGDTEKLKELLAREAGKLFYSDGYGRTALHVACDNQQEAAVSLLLGLGARVNAQDKYGFTPLHGARTKPIAEALLKKGAQVNAKSNRALTPLHIAARDCHEDVAASLIAARADISARDDQGNTPLHEASAQNAKPGLAIAKLLVEKGADVNPGNNDGATPLHQVVHYYQQLDALDLARLLIENKADTTARLSGELFLGVTEIAGMTAALTVEAKEVAALHIAAMEGRTDMVKVLLGYGVAVNVPDGEGNTALTWAQKMGKDDTAQYLRQEGGLE